VHTLLVNTACRRTVSYVFAAAGVDAGERSLDIARFLDAAVEVADGGDQQRRRHSDVTTDDVLCLALTGHIGLDTQRQYGAPAH